VLVFFFFHLMAALYRRPPGGADALLVVVGLLPSWVSTTRSVCSLTRHKTPTPRGERETNDLRRTFKWIAGHTTNDGPLTTPTAK